MVIFELSSGRRPFHRYAEDDASFVTDFPALLKEGPPEQQILRPGDNEISQDFLDIIYWMLEKDANNSIAMPDSTSASEVLEKLEGIDYTILNEETILKELT